MYLYILSFVIGYIQIVEFRFELLSDMTVVPQQYTLHCVTIGDDGYTITVYGNDQQIYSENCENGNCIEQLLYSSNGTYDNTVNITWDTETISSGSYSQSVNGDQIYRCNVVLYSSNRNRYLTVKGINYFLFLNNYNSILSSRIFSFSY